MNGRVQIGQVAVYRKDMEIQVEILVSPGVWRAVPLTLDEAHTLSDVLHMFIDD